MGKVTRRGMVQKEAHRHDQGRNGLPGQAFSLR